MLHLMKCSRPTCERFWYFRFVEYLLEPALSMCRLPRWHGDISRDSWKRIGNAVMPQSSSTASCLPRSNYGRARSFAPKPTAKCVLRIALRGELLTSAAR
jgi:hypothetical protein